MKNMTKFALAALLTTVAASNVDAANFDFSAFSKKFNAGQIRSQATGVAQLPAPATNFTMPATYVAPPAQSPAGDPVAQLTAAGKIVVNLNAPSPDTYIATNAANQLLTASVNQARAAYQAKIVANLNAPSADTYIATNAANQLLTAAVNQAEAAKDALVKDRTTLVRDAATGFYVFDTDSVAQTLIKKADADAAVQVYGTALYDSAYSRGMKEFALHLTGTVDAVGNVVPPAETLINGLRLMPLATDANLVAFIDHLNAIERAPTLQLLGANVMANLKIAAGAREDAANNVGAKEAAVQAVLGADNDHITAAKADGSNPTQSLLSWLVDGITR